MAAGLSLLSTWGARFEATPDASALPFVWTLADVGFLAGLGYGVLRANRVAAAGLLVYYLVTRTSTVATLGAAGGFWIALGFLLVFGHGLWGALALHRLGERDPLAEQVEAIENPGAEGA